MCVWWAIASTFVDIFYFSSTHRGSPPFGDAPIKKSQKTFNISAFPHAHCTFFWFQNCVYNACSINSNSITYTASRTLHIACIDRTPHIWFERRCTNTCLIHTNLLIWTFGTILNHSIINCYTILRFLDRDSACKCKQK